MKGNLANKISFENLNWLQSMVGSHDFLVNFGSLNKMCKNCTFLVMHFFEVDSKALHGYYFV